MPSYAELMLAELQQQRSEQSRQHGELLGVIASLTQATQRLEQALTQLQAQAQAVAATQAPPPAENLHWLGRLGRWAGQLFGGSKNAAKAILGK